MENPFFQGQPVQQAYTAQGMNPYAQPVQNSTYVQQTEVTPQAEPQIPV